MTKKYEAAANWAEEEMELPSPTDTTRSGAAAAEHGRETLARAKAGRPPKDPTERRSENLQIRLTPQEMADLTTAAEAAGRPVRAWAREAVINRVRRSLR